MIVVDSGGWLSYFAGDANAYFFAEAIEDIQLHRLAASAALQHRLAMADAIIWQTAQTHGAALYTQDVDLQGLPGVVFRPKQPS